LSFWSSSPDISQKHKWKVEFKGELLKGQGDNKVFFAKSVDKPSYTVKTTSYKYLYSHEFKFPTRISWNPIRLSLYDVIEKGVATNVHSMLTGFGYKPPYSEDTGNEIVSTYHFKDRYKLTGLNIIQLGSGSGDKTEPKQEIWSLKNALITDIKYDTLDYSSDAPVVIEMTIAYDWATLTQ
jgi:hypothetical protein